MTAYEAEFVSSPETEAAAIANIAVQGAEPHDLEPGMLYSVPDGAGGVKILDTTPYDVAPLRKTGARTVIDAKSFVDYVNRHKSAGTEVYADTPRSTVCAVLDAHNAGEGLAGWEKHKLSLSLEHSKAWLAWIAHDLGSNPRGWFSQQEFAEFIEDRALDVQDPDHARLIELAMKFEATSKVDFASAVRLDNGEVQFSYVETVGQKKGDKGQLEFPKELKLAIRPYIGGPIYFVFAALRYRMGADGLRLGYALQRPENILEAAFSDIVTEIRDGKTNVDSATKAETRVHDGIGDVPIFYGRP